MIAVIAIDIVALPKSQQEPGLRVPLRYAVNGRHAVCGGVTEVGV